MTKHLVVVACAAALALSLAACQTPGADEVSLSPSPSASASASVIASPSPSPLPSETVAAAMDCPTLDESGDDLPVVTIGANRYGEICVGMSFAEAAAVSGAPVVGAEPCTWISTLVEQVDPGLYVEAVTEPDAQGERIFMFRMTWAGDPTEANNYDVPRTEEGISIGSTPAEVMAAYPGATAITREDVAAGTRQQIVAPVTPDYTLVFDVTPGTVGTIYWGEGLAQGSQAELCAL